MTSGSAGVSSSGSLNEHENDKRDSGIHHRADPASAHGIDRAPGIRRHAPDPGADDIYGRMAGMKRLIAFILMALMLTGCAKTERVEEAKAQSVSYQTYEAVGKHFNGNPYARDDDILIPHGKMIVYPTRSFGGIRDYLEKNYIEGIVFWLDGEPKCKIKRTDFGFGWGSRS